MNLEEKMRKELKRYIVSRQIFCPITKKVLDIRTAQFTVDADGDPKYAFDPSLHPEVITAWLDAR